MNHGNTKAVICWQGDDKYDAPKTMESLKDKVPTLQHIIVIGNSEDKHHSFAKLIEGSDPTPINDPPIASDPCILCFTSGTSADVPEVKQRIHGSLAIGGSFIGVGSEPSISFAKL